MSFQGYTKQKKAYGVKINLLCLLTVSTMSTWKRRVIIAPREQRAIVIIFRMEKDVMYKFFQKLVGQHPNDIRKRIPLQ